MYKEISKEIQDYIIDELKLSSWNSVDKIVVLTEGKSGATVFRLHVISRQKRITGYYIVKLMDIDKPWYRHSENEGVKGKDAYSASEQFKKHITKVVCSKEIGKELVVIYKQANNSVISSISLEKLSKSKAVFVIENLSYDTLGKWNCNSCFNGTSNTFFEDILSYRLERGGVFEKRISKFLLNRNAKSFLFRNHVYPNPYYYILNISTWSELIESHILLKGNTHGDFHRKNIITTEEAGKIDYAIIDFDCFNTDSYLLYDHAYLETSIMYDTIMSYNITEWLEISNILLKTDIQCEIENAIDEDVYLYRNAICKGFNKWLSEEEQRNSKDILCIQFYMARLAASINYFCKQLITDETHQLKMLIYSSLCLTKLLEILQSKDVYSDSVSNLIPLTANTDFSEMVDKQWLNYLSSHYIPILITDDSYVDIDYSLFTGLKKVKWSLVIEIGKNNAPNDFSSSVARICSQTSKIEYHNLQTDNENEVSYIPDACLWLQAKKGSSTYLKLWRDRKKCLCHVMRQIHERHGLKSLLFLFDIQEGSKFVWNLILELMDNEEQIRGARIVELRKPTADRETIEELNRADVAYTIIDGATLLDVSKVIDETQEDDTSNINNGIFLPSIQERGVVRVSDEEARYYETSVELIYPGMERLTESWDYGDGFYKGNEVQWNDLANNCDIPLMPDYERYRKGLLHIVEEESPRIKIQKIIHDPGVGGTTLSKRLLWDLKEKIPCVILKRYTDETKNILLAIYRKTKKRVLILVEYGPMTINHDQLDELCYDVNEENGRLLILITERRLGKVDSSGIEAKLNNIFISLPGRIENNDIATRFQNTFISKTQDKERRALLRRITNNGSGIPWTTQRTPFFYGFYTFQEEYNLQHFNLAERIQSEYEKELLIDLALLTIYSQKACISYEEIYKRNKIDFLSISFARLYEQHSHAIKSIIVEKDDGWRLCHPRIAELVLKNLYSCEIWKECIYDASSRYIDHLYQLYGSDSDYANRILRELFIDRTDFNTEKASFSLLITDIGKITQRKELFEKLTTYYPRNPHYYSHLARLVAFKSNDDVINYDEAIELLNKAIEVARNEGLPEITHYITLGSVYGRKISDYIYEERKKYKRNPSAYKGIKGIIDDISNDYQNAANAFKSARRQMKKIDSYYFYPYISLETTIIYKLLWYDKSKLSLSQLYTQDNDFSKWYNIHYPKIVGLLEDMQRNAESVDLNYTIYLERAKDKVKTISIEDNEWMTRRLDIWADKDGINACHQRRMIVTSLYANAGYNWKNINGSNLKMMEKSMYKNIMMTPATDIVKNDIYRWYAVTSYLESFDPYKVIEIFDEYIGDDYRKEYILYQMYFLLLTRGVAKVEKVIEHINKCKALLPAGINDISNRDVYLKMEDSTINPIVPIRNVKERDKIQSSQLADFSGRITAVSESSHGKIEMDGYNISITFNPIFTDDTGKKVVFSIESEQTPVLFNLMFTYSGLRAWNVRRIVDPE